MHLTCAGVNSTVFHEAGYNTPGMSELTNVLGAAFLATCHIDLSSILLGSRLVTDYRLAMTRMQAADVS